RTAGALSPCVDPVRSDRRCWSQRPAASFPSGPNSMQPCRSCPDSNDRNPSRSDAAHGTHRALQPGHVPFWKGRMKLRHGLCAAIAAVALFVANGVGATTLEEALILAYQNNPRLLAARAELRSVDEGVNQAISQGRPDIIAFGDIGRQWSETDTLGGNWHTPRSVGLDLRQPVYRGGSIEAGEERAENQVLAQRARLAEVEQAVFGDVVLAFMNVVRDEAELALQENNEAILARQLQATRDRFEVGEVTRTDVAQSESRLALATAQRIE